ncbi:MAG: polysaccharide pyruvyl transferase family protein [Clostridia bacterium]|nr:polysaccharide pyruvyl transferase family protein [Clostridia bacterium]
MVIQLKTTIYRLYRYVRRLVQIVCYTVRTRFRKEQIIFLIGTPEHGNMGDQLIALGELAWLRDHYPNVPIREFTHDTLLQDRQCRVLRAQIRKEDILFLHGGGNLNDKYVACEKIRRIIIQKKPENRIILFPQSVSYAETPQAQKLKQDTSRIYNAHPDFTILAREEQSFANAKQMFPSLRTILIPDIATYLFRSMGPSSAFRRDGIALCLRSDGERYYEKKEIEALRQTLCASYSVRITDTHVHRRVLPQERRTAAQTMIDAFAHNSLIVTDRFHGVIFSILSRTPCIALRSCDHKVIDGVKWFKDFAGVFYAESTEDVRRLVQTAYGMGEQPQKDFSRYFDRLCKELSLDLERNRNG